MDKDYFVELTTHLYNLTLLFPKKEPLRYQIRRLANEVLDSLISILKGSIKDPQGLLTDADTKLETLVSFLEVAKTQNWVSPDNIFEIQREYSKIRREIEKFKIGETKKFEKIQGPKMVPVPMPREGVLVNERQEKILEILKEEEKVQVHHVKKIFPDVSKRTLRRDFESLLTQGLVERIGDGNNTFYKLNPKTEDRTVMS